MTIDLTDPVFHDEDKAREWLTQARWPNGVNCVHCGSVDGVSTMGGKRHRVGLYHCRQCGGQFTVLTGSVMESNRSKLGVEDTRRAEKLTKGMEGKRLTYRRIAGQGESLEG